MRQEFLPHFGIKVKRVTFWGTLLQFICREEILPLFLAQLISLGNSRDNVREDELLSKFLYKAYFGKVF